MPGSGLGGLAEGLWGYIDKERQEAQQRENTAAQREAQILSTLANSDDPEIASMALAGMLEQANPKRKAKGMRGFLGEMEASATLPKIRELLNTPVQQQVTTPGLPSRGIPAAVTMRGAPPAPSGGQGRVEAALAGMAPPQAAAAPPPNGLTPLLPQSQLGRGEPPPAPQSAFSEQRGTPAVGRVDTVSTPRQAFRQPEERLRRDTIAREQAAVEGRVAGRVAAGMPREEALKLEQRYMRGGAGAYGTLAEADVIPDPQSPTGYSRPLYDKRTGQVMGSLPAMDPTRTRAGAGIDRGDPAEIAAGIMGYASSEEVPRERYQELLATAGDVAKKLSYERRTGTGQAAVEQGPTGNDKFARLKWLDDQWQESSKTARTMDAAMATMNAGIDAVKRGDANAGGQAVLITFQKMLDPVSVVRESEYLRSAVGLTLLDQWQGMYERLVKTGGAGVPVEELQQFIAVAQDIQKRTNAALRPRADRLAKMAAKFEVDPTDFLPAEYLTPPAAGQPGGPPATATTSAAQYTPGLKYQHPVYGWVEVQDPPLNAQGKPRIKRTTPPTQTP